jgi:hypothetical protein
MLILHREPGLERCVEDHANRDERHARHLSCAASQAFSADRYRRQSGIWCSKGERHREPNIGRLWNPDVLHHHGYPGRYEKVRRHEPNHVLHRYRPNRWYCVYVHGAGKPKQLADRCISSVKERHPGSVRRSANLGNKLGAEIDDHRSKARHRDPARNFQRLISSPKRADADGLHRQQEDHQSRPPQAQLQPHISSPLGPPPRLDSRDANDNLHPNRRRSQHRLTDRNAEEKQQRRNRLVAPPPRVPKTVPTNTQAPRKPKQTGGKARFPGHS